MTTWLRLLLLCSLIILHPATPFMALSGPVTRLASQSDGGRFATQIAASTSSRGGDDDEEEVVWVPPSQQLLQSKSTIFKINNPEDFLSFISEDDRLTVIKVYASWCQTCKKIDLRYRKLASKFGDKYNNDNNNVNGGTATDQITTAPPIKQRGRVRFAELQYDNPQNEDLCNHLLETTSFPYFLMYRRRQGKIRGFHCTPAKFQVLINAVEELLADEEKVEQQEEEDCVVDDSFQQQVIDLGLMDRR